MPDLRCAVDRNWCCAWKPAGRSSPWRACSPCRPGPHGSGALAIRPTAGPAWRTGRAGPTPARGSRPPVCSPPPRCCGAPSGPAGTAPPPPPSPRPAAPAVAQRYEHAAVGDLLHLDSKKLGRIRGLGHRVTGQRFHRFSGAGWEYLHVAVDDHSRVAYVELLPDEGQATARRFLRGALRWFRAHRVRVRRILTDNGSAYRSRSFRAACRALRVSHRRTRPYTPRTNGKAEGFIQRALGGGASGRPYYTSADRSRVLRGWVEHYNCARPHTSLNRQPPMSRFPRGNNLMLVHT